MKPNSSGNKGTNFSIYTKNLPNKKNLLDRLNFHVMQGLYSMTSPKSVALEQPVMRTLT